MSRRLDPLRLAGLGSRAVQGPLFLVSFAGFIAAVYAQAAWLQHVGAVVGIGFGLTGAVGLWLRRRARHRQEPGAEPPRSVVGQFDPRRKR